MMFNYPFFSFRNKTYPFRYYNYPYNPTYRPFREQQNDKITENNLDSKNYNLIKETSNCKSESSKKDEQFFSILGIHLYFDDLIILALLFFLYNEGVKDEGLFICLILLLLS